MRETWTEKDVKSGKPLYPDGRDLRQEPYVEHKRMLQKLLKGAPENIVFLEYLEGDGRRIFERACKPGLEGIVAPSLMYSYTRSRRASLWIRARSQGGTWKACKKLKVGEAEVVRRAP